MTFPPPPHAKSRGTVVSRRAVLREYLRTGRYLSIPEQGDSEIIRGQSEKKKKSLFFQLAKLLGMLLVLPEQQ